MKPHSFSTLDTDIVVDVGCLAYEAEDSINALIKRFSPKVLFGFDPHPALVERVGDVYGTTVITIRRAAWTNDGEVGLTLQGNCTHVDGNEELRAEAFDLAAWVRTLPAGRIVLKVDVEGAEYVLLPHLIRHGLMDRFSLLIVEWHSGALANGFESDRESILRDIPCPVEEWH